MLDKYRGHLSYPVEFETPWKSTGVLRWSPDGRRLTCLLWRGVGSSVNIWGQPILGRSLRQITHVPDQIVAYDWSPDGKQLAYTRRLSTGDVVLITTSIDN